MTLLQSSIVPGGATSGYQISRSLRFNIADSAYLNRTPASNGNRKTWTFSTWVKRSSLGALQAMLSAPYSANSDAIRFEAADTLIIFSNDGNNCNLTTTQVFRDVSSWYHIVVAVDTTQATSSNRVKLYVNGTQVTAFGTATYPTQNYDFNINANVAQNIGRNNLTASQYLGGYMTEIYFIDGQALAPTAFGATSTTTGVWNPIAYTGTYGTNGFYLNFSDNSNTTAATLGKDYSGNGNNWTPNNFSVTAGAGNDSLVDTPTNYGTDTGIGGEVRGNYCTFNPLDAANQTTANGNLDTASNGSAGRMRATLGVSSGKWYWEHTLTNYANGGGLGIMEVSSQLGTSDLGGGISAATSWGILTNSGNISNNSTTTGYGSASGTNDILMCALDMNAGKVWWGKNGTWFASGSPASGTNAAFSNVTGTIAPAIGLGNGSSQSWSHNFGQRAFAYTAPSGFKALVTQNLPTPTVGASSTTLANKYFDVSLWTGAGQTGTASITGLAFQPDFVWSKSRSSAVSHLLYDVLRGPSTSGASKSLSSNASAAEGSGNDNTTYGYLSAFNSDGFSYYGGSSPTYFSANSGTYVGWQWKGGGTGVSNTNGSITSTVSANTTSGFSVVTYTGNGTSGATIGHGLGAVPKMVIFKCRNTAYDWLVYQSTMGNTGLIALNSSAAQQTGRGDFLNSTTPSSSLVTLGNTLGVNESTKTYVAYCFAEVAGFSKISSYVGNGSSDGPFIYTGFRPRYVVIKQSGGTTNWVAEDAARSPYNVVSALLNPNATNTENTSVNEMDFVSNGFKIRTTDIGYNSSGGNYIYMAFAESPFNYSRAR